jgi:hypothetical protein
MKLAGCESIWGTAKNVPFHRKLQSLDHEMIDQQVIETRPSLDPRRKLPSCNGRF